MASFLGILKAIFIPALIALVIYVVLTYFVLPFVRAHRQRYTQYLPLHGSLEGLSDRTSSFRHRLSDALLTVFIPSRWSRDRRWVVHSSGGEDRSSDELFDDEEGEGMVGFDIDERRRGALERRRSSLGESDRRLSRELEEGFKDDSDDDDDTDEDTDRRRTWTGR